MTFSDQPRVSTGAAGQKLMIKRQVPEGVNKAEKEAQI
jgi:hypothetical protein